MIAVTAYLSFSSSVFHTIYKDMLKIIVKLPNKQDTLTRQKKNFEEESYHVSLQIQVLN
jgi:hypothetical protein